MYKNFHPGNDFCGDNSIIKSDCFQSLIPSYKSIYSNECLNKSYCTLDLANFFNSSYPVQTKNCFEKYSKMFIQIQCNLSEDEVTYNKNIALIVAFIGALIAFFYYM